jgi:putative spermidine/putrescine transport system ATP-binding protein
MNGGKIAQAGTAREIFNTPKNEFVAKFIGGHNVLGHGKQKYAVRFDRIKIKPPKSRTSLPAVTAQVSDIEYQGNVFHVNLRGAMGEELALLLNESDFDQAPLSVGATVTAIWDPASAHALG